MHDTGVQGGAGTESAGEYEENQNSTKDCTQPTTPYNKQLTHMKGKREFLKKLGRQNRQDKEQQRPIHQLNDWRFDANFWNNGRI